MKEQFEALGFKETISTSKKRVRNPYQNYGVPKKVDVGGFKGSARNRLRNCDSPIVELRLLIREAYELFGDQQAKKIVGELHRLKDNLSIGEIISKKMINNLW